MASFVLSFFPLDVLDEIWDVIESVSEDFPTYSYIQRKIMKPTIRLPCLRILPYNRENKGEKYLKPGNSKKKKLLKKLLNRLRIREEAVVGELAHQQDILPKGTRKCSRNAS